MNKVKEIFIDNIQYIRLGEMTLPKYVKDLNDNWVGKINIENLIYADEEYEETITVKEAIQYLIKNEYKVVNEVEYNNNRYNVLLKEIEEKIHENNCEIKNLQEKNKELEKEKLKILDCMIKEEL